MVYAFLKVKAQMKITFIILNFHRVFSFGFQVHALIGDSVYKLLPIEVQTNLSILLEGISFGEASVWADKIKRNREYLWTKQIHYYNGAPKSNDDPPNKCIFNESFPLSKPNENPINLLDALEKYKPPIQSAFQLKMFLHLMQDLHQPLHLTGKFRGGNDVSIRVKKRTYSLHSFWDSGLYKLSPSYTFQPLSCEPFDLKKWANELYSENCKLIWHYDDPDYLEKSKELLKEVIEFSVMRTACALGASQRIPDYL